MRITSEAIGGDLFWKTELPPTLFNKIGLLGVFGPNFQAIREVYIPYEFVQSRLIRVKTK